MISPSILTTAMPKSVINKYNCIVKVITVFVVLVCKTCLKVFCFYNTVKKNLLILVLRFFMRLIDEINRNTDATVKGLFPPLCIFRWLEILCIYSLYTVISLTLPGSFIKLCLFINSDRLLIYIMSFFCILMQYKHFLTSLYIIVGY